MLRLVQVMATLIENALDNQTRATEVAIGIFADADNLRGDIACPKLFPEFFLIKELVESDCDDLRLYLFDRPEHVGLIPEDCMVHGS